MGISVIALIRYTSTGRRINFKIHNMKNSEQHAFPLERHEINESGVPETVFQTGLTKREYFAGLAMQGILSRSGDWNGANLDFVSKQAVYHADDLLEQLNNKHENK